MKLSVRGEYALRALLVLGLNYGDGVVRIQTISEQQNIPKKFLEQILNDLKALVASRRGLPRGPPAAKHQPGVGGASYGRGAGSGQLRQRQVLRALHLP